MNAQTLLSDKNHH